MKIEAYNLSMAGVLTRFYLMMATAISLGFLGVSWVAVSFVTFLIAFSVILGVSFEIDTAATTKATTSTLTAVKGGRTTKKVG